MTLSLNAHGEIVDVQEADQFQWASGKPLTQFACGYFAVAMAKSLALPGYPPTLTMQQVISDALSWYQAFDGTDAITNTNGMTLAQLYTLLQHISLHFQATATDVGTIKGWIQAGYPVIIAITEVSVHDLALGDASPYPWKAAGTHIILVTGIAANGNILVRDSANCTDLHNPNSLRPGPRTYDAGKIQLVSATVAVPPWMPRPPSATPPAPLIAPTATSGVPEGWQYTNGRLIASNTLEVAHEFIPSILTSQWNPDNTPEEKAILLDQLEVSNPSLGAGLQQMFRDTVLELPDSKGRVLAMYAGRELYATRQQVMKYYALAKQMRDYAAKLETDLQAMQKALPQS